MIEHITESGITYKVETDTNGDKSWYFNGKLHRVDGPVIELSDGYKSWYLNGKPHRVDGPAIEWDNVNKSWYLNGEELTEEEFNEFRKAYEYLKQHPEDALRYVNHKHLNFVAKEILGD